MTEKELTHKRERKVKRRKVRKKDLAKDPLKMMKKELAHLEAVELGMAGIENLIARGEDVHEERKATRSDRDT
jgi:hypothetical protein